jgi:hypothetical protein
MTTVPGLDVSFELCAPGLWGAKTSSATMASVIMTGRRMTLAHVQAAL